MSKKPNDGAPTQRRFPGASSAILAAALPLGLLFFLSRPFQGTQAPNYAVLFSGMEGLEFVKEIWFGVDLPEAPFTGERFVAFGAGALIFLACLAVGRAIFVPFRKRLNASRLETAFFSGLLGLAFISFLLLILGLSGRANTTLAPAVVSVALIGVVWCVTAFFKRRRSSGQNSNVFGAVISPLCELNTVWKRRDGFGRTTLVFQIALLVLFTSFYLFAATQPLFEYDALEYHAQGAREIFESGIVGFSDHNVYTNMPLGCELLYVAGFDFFRDFGCNYADTLRLGSLAGKTLITFFVLLTGIGLIAFSRRFFGRRSPGVWAAIILMSFPGVFSVYANGLNEGALAACALALTHLFFVCLANRSILTNIRDCVPFAILAGLICGFAISVKYTAVVFLMAPAGLFLAFVLFCPAAASRLGSALSNAKSSSSARSLSRKRRALGSLAALALFAVATAVVAGGWYWRNFSATGNPVFPLAKSVFGDPRGLWPDAVDARWKHAHSPSGFGPGAFEKAVAQSLWDSQGDCLSPFYLFVPLFCIFAFTPGILRSKQLKATIALFAVLTALFWTAWFLATHRLTRFLIPVAPAVAIILGQIFSVALGSRNRFLRGSALATALISLLWSGIVIDFISQGRMAPLRALERDPARFSSDSIWFSDHPELFFSGSYPDSQSRRLLLVGEARAFAYRAPVVSATCWDVSPLEKIIEGAIELNDDGLPVRITDEKLILDRLNEERIDFIVVSFSELERFRSPGNYGFRSAVVGEELFRLLVWSDILEPWTPPELTGQLSGVQLFRTRLSNLSAPAVSAAQD